MESPGCSLGNHGKQNRKCWGEAGRNGQEKRWRWGEQGRRSRVMA